MPLVAKDMRSNNQLDNHWSLVMRDIRRPILKTNFNVLGIKAPFVLTTVSANINLS